MWWQVSWPPTYLFDHARSRHHIEFGPHISHSSMATPARMHEAAKTRLWPSMAASRAEVAGRVVLSEQLAGRLRRTAVVEVDEACADVLLLTGGVVGDASLA
jgi:hypothetical protein